MLKKSQQIEQNNEDHLQHIYFLGKNTDTF